MPEAKMHRVDGTVFDVRDVVANETRPGVYLVEDGPAGALEAAWGQAPEARDPSTSADPHDDGGIDDHLDTYSSDEEPDGDDGDGRQYLARDWRPVERYGAAMAVKALDRVEPQSYREAMKLPEANEWRLGMATRK